jgi:hypothetical protein
MRGATPPLPQYAFMAWCSVKKQHRDNFTFIINTCLDPMSHIPISGETGSTPNVEWVSLDPLRPSCGRAEGVNKVNTHNPIRGTETFCSARSR